MENLSPQIFRQRLVIEGKCSQPITGEQIKEYLSKLSEALNMKTLIEPVTHKSEKYGWAGWIHWDSSGCHFYAWDKPFPFFSSDIYTCKKFDVKTAVKITQEFFKTIEIVSKEV
jgi:S-adenosylmethionine decarboxylase